MPDDNILKQVLKNLGQIAEETGKEAITQAGKMTESIITGKELLGDIRPMTDQEIAQKKAEDEKRKQQEIAELQAKLGPGRNVEAEVKQIRSEKEQEEDQKEKEFLENLRRQREAEEAERQQMGGMGQESANPSKRKKKRGSAMGGGKKKSNMPDPASMSATSEKTGGKID